MNPTATSAATRLIAAGQAVDTAWLQTQLKWCAQRLDAMLPRFGDRFPSACTTDMHYRVKLNDDWTNGFWTAMLLLKNWHWPDAGTTATIQAQLASFKQRLADHYVLDHHDIGFLYSLSSYAYYTFTHSPADKTLTLAAAETLSARFQPRGQFIQAWGKPGAANEYRLIIDSLLNLPLLFEASRLSGNDRYAAIARAHYHSVIGNIIRADQSTYHTFYFDPATGAPDHGATHQGFSDESCWARGQAWILLGMPLYHKFNPATAEGTQYQQLLEYYLNHLSADLIPYWDLTFTAADQQPKDSSAAAIVACGLIEAQKQGYCANGVAMARGIVQVLTEHYRTNNAQEGLLQHSVYAYNEDKGVDEANLWGDYFYMEALQRLADPAWATFW